MHVYIFIGDIMKYILLLFSYNYFTHTFILFFSICQIEQVHFYNPKRLCFVRMSFFALTGGCERHVVCNHLATDVRVKTSSICL